MNFSLLLTVFLIGMLIGVLIMDRIYNNYLKEMQKIDVDFEDWEVQRHKEFIAELDEIEKRGR